MEKYFKSSLRRGIEMAAFKQIDFGTMDVEDELNSVYTSDMV